MTLLKALIKNGKVKLDERELMEFNKIYRWSFLIFLIFTWVYFEFFETGVFESYFFSGYTGTICMIGVLFIVLKGLSISYKNLDLLIPALYFTSFNITLIVFSIGSGAVRNIIRNIAGKYMMQASIGFVILVMIILFVIINYIYKYGLKRLDKELED